MKIAFTSQNFRTITGHAGQCKRFLILELGPDGEQLGVQHLDLPAELAFHNFQGGAHPVDGCDLLVTQSCGMGFLQRLAAKEIRVVVTGESDPTRAATALFRGESLPPPEPSRDDHHHCGCGSSHHP